MINAKVNKEVIEANKLMWTVASEVMEVFAKHDLTLEQASVVNRTITDTINLENNRAWQSYEFQRKNAALDAYSGAAARPF